MIIIRGMKNQRMNLNANYCKKFELKIFTGKLTAKTIH